jgi:hypothetical protein
MKNNREVVEYLKPYTEMVGIHLKNKIIINRVTDLFDTHLSVKIDVKTSWVGDVNNRDIAIKRFLKKNGFKYHSQDSTYRRLFFQHEE